MNTVYKFPASKLPAELRGGISDEASVTVQVSEDTNDVLPGFARDEIDALVAPTITQVERGEYTVCETPEDHDAFFDSIKIKALAGTTSK